MSVFGFYFDLVFGFLFFWWKEWDNKETKGDADVTRRKDFRINGIFTQT